MRGSDECKKKAELWMVASEKWKDEFLVLMSTRE